MTNKIENEIDAVLAKLPDIQSWKRQVIEEGLADLRQDQDQHRQDVQDVLLIDGIDGEHPVVSSENRRRQLRLLNGQHFSKASKDLDRFHKMMQGITCLDAPDVIVSATKNEFCATEEEVQALIDGLLQDTPKELYAREFHGSWAEPQPLSEEDRHLSDRWWADQHQEAYGWHGWHGSRGNLGLDRTSSPREQAFDGLDKTPMDWSLLYSVQET